MFLLNKFFRHFQTNDSDCVLFILLALLCLPSLLLLFTALHLAHTNKPAIKHHDNWNLWCVAKHEISICVRFTWLSNVHTNTVPAALVFNRLCNIAATLAIIIIIQQIRSLISVSKIWIVVESYAFFFYCPCPIESKIRAMEPNPNRQYCKLKIELHLDRNIRNHY